MEAVVERELTVLMSSHLLADLERVCDRLVVLAAGGVQLSGRIDEIVASHRVLVGLPGDDAAVARVHQVVQARHTSRQTVLLVRANGHVYDARWQIEDVALEDIVLAYLQQPETGGRGMTWVAWRQQRAEMVLGALVLAVLAALFVPTGLHMSGAYETDGAAACVGAPEGGCAQLLDAFDAVSRRSSA